MAMAQGGDSWNPELARSVEEDFDAGGDSWNPKWTRSVEKDFDAGGDLWNPESARSVEKDFDAECNADRRIVLLGKTGAGKSHSGNAMIGEKCFPSRKSCDPVTNEVTDAIGFRAGRSILVYDTPGSSDPYYKDELARDVLDCLLATIPGFHCLTMVISCTARVTEEEDGKLFDILMKSLGENFMSYVIVIFTKTEQNEMDRMIREVMDTGDSFFKRFLEATWGRHVCFGNDNNEVNSRHVDEYFNKLEEMVRHNRMNNMVCYRHRLYEKVQKIVEEEAAKIKKKENDLPMPVCKKMAMLKARNDEIPLLSRLKSKSLKCCSLI